ncbi:hypothetical protein E1B28_012249 [Marasmius oreades]|uniref:PDZ GRASP-type domain-containing protein n=1 Tax=Marasmius oreades TaxID=181124 RepID=A0A9P7UNH8_9AGAR|nr:uncharacterized protein E1B28_012249 [Marasmius oreades]KAG7088233.1 hypothetical protein E1B28_012249 [Marasmius oreades]
MGASQSTNESNYPPSRALHVLRVTPSSPAFQASIEPFFDFIVGFDDPSISSSSSSNPNIFNASELEKIVESHEGRVLNLMVWNSKNQEMRVVPIVPSREWSQPSSPQEDTTRQPSLLGLSMRMCEPEFALDNVWHVLDVLEGSPAESAGLVPYGDYITGWSGGTLSAENDFYDLVEAHVDKPLRVYVYSHDFDALREVVLVPNRHWGGAGLLGCVFGYGLLHRIPSQTGDRTVPPELAEEDPEEYEEQQLFVPADLHGNDPINGDYNPNQLAEWRRQQEQEEQWHRESQEAQSIYEANAHSSFSSIMENEEDEDETEGTTPVDEKTYSGHLESHNHEITQRPSFQTPPPRLSSIKGVSQTFLGT